MKVRIIGVASEMEMFDYLFGVSLGDLILRHSDNLSRTLQKAAISAAEAQEVAKMTLETLKSLRTDANFKLFGENVSKIAENLNVNEPCLPRRR